jgi:hypothetical protein
VSAADQASLLKSSDSQLYNKLNVVDIEAPMESDVFEEEMTPMFTLKGQLNQSESKQSSEQPSA